MAGHGYLLELGRAAIAQVEINVTDVDRPTQPAWRQRVEELISSLGLVPHPEGGHYRQLFRSGSEVQPVDHRPRRSALTTIYFLLNAGEVSCWHRVASDEAWHFYEGDPLELVTATEDFAQVSRHRLGRYAADSRPVHVVEAGRWQAARSTGQYTLVGCTVAPGFEFEDFRMLRDDPEKADNLRRSRPDLAAFISPAL